MSPLKRLLLAVEKAQRENELPDFLAERISVLAEHLREDSTLQVEIDDLIEQLSLYDTYGQTGYIGMGVDHHILDLTLCRIERRLSACPKGTKE